MLRRFQDALSLSSDSIDAYWCRLFALLTAIIYSYDQQLIIYSLEALKVCF